MAVATEMCKTLYRGDEVHAEKMKKERLAGEDGNGGN